MKVAEIIGVPAEDPDMAGGGSSVVELGLVSVSGSLDGCGPVAAFVCEGVGFVMPVMPSGAKGLSARWRGPGRYSCLVSWDDGSFEEGLEFSLDEIEFVCKDEGVLRYKRMFDRLRRIDGIILSG